MLSSTMDTIYDKLKLVVSTGHYLIVKTMSISNFLSNYRVPLTATPTPRARPGTMIASRACGSGTLTGSPPTRGEMGRGEEGERRGGRRRGWRGEGVVSVTMAPG